MNFDELYLEESVLTGYLQWTYTKQLLYRNWPFHLSLQEKILWVLRRQVQEKQQHTYCLSLTNYAATLISRKPSTQSLWLLHVTGATNWPANRRLFVLYACFGCSHIRRNRRNCLCIAVKGAANGSRYCSRDPGTAYQLYQYGLRGFFQNVFFV